MRKPICLFVTGAACAALALSSSRARADALLEASGAYVHPLVTHVDVQVVEQVATTTAEVEFASPSDGGQLLFPVPDGASVVGFSLFQDGTWQDAHITDLAPESHAPVPQAPGGQDGNASLDAYLGDDSLAITLPPSTAPVHARITMIALLPYELGNVSYRYPLAPLSWAASKTEDDLSISVHVASKRPLQGFSAPGYDALQTSSSLAPDHLDVTYAASAFTPTDDFRFTYGVGDVGDLFVDLLVDHESCDEDGFFLLVVDPKQDVAESQALPKNFSFVMDVSGSMQGYKIDQAKKAASAAIDQLNDQDAFDVLTFSTDVNALFMMPTAVSAAARQKAHQFVDASYPDGGTNLHDAIVKGVQGPASEDRARILVLLTDGQPTEGVTDIPTILKDVKAANASDTRIFAFGIGADVNASFLTALAAENRGEAKLLAASSDISGTLSDFFLKIDRPVLTDVTLDWGGAVVHDVYPDGVTDLFAGTELLVVGRYSGAAQVTGTLSGKLAGAPTSYTYPLDLPACAKDQNAFLPRFWAKSKIDALIAYMAENGEDPDIVRQIEELAAKYGIQTPYTRFASGGSSTGTNGGTSGGTSSSGSSQASNGNGAYGSSSSYGTGSPDHYAGGGLVDSSSCSASARSGSNGAPFALGIVAIAAAVAGRRRRARR